MKDIRELPTVLERAVKDMPNWDVKDQLAFTFKVVELADMADNIMRSYDGRKKRMSDLINILRKEREDD